MLYTLVPAYTSEKVTEVCPKIINLCFMLDLLFGENCMVRKVTKMIFSQNFSLSFSTRCLLPDILLS